MFLFSFVLPLVLEDQYNPRLVKELLNDLSSTLHNLTIHVGRCVLVGNVNIWMCRLETILKWQQQLNNLQIPKVEDVLVFLCTCMGHCSPSQNFSRSSLFCLCVNVTFKKGSSRK